MKLPHWEQITESCRDHGVLVVADEVLTGGGRTGTFLASEQFGIEPDLVTLSKGMANGFPFAVLAGRAEVLRHPHAAKAGSTASTYANNPLGIAAARATLEVVRRDTLLTQVADLGALMDQRLSELKAQYQILGDVRGIGLLHGLEFVRDRSTREPAPEIARAVYQHALDLGLRTAVGGHIIRLAPPFTIDRSLLEEGLALLRLALERATGDVR